MSRKIGIKASQLHHEARLPGLVFSGADILIDAITADSRQVKPGTLFAALPGSRVDGVDFIPQALAAGASGVIFADSASPSLPNSIASFSHPIPRVALAHLAKAFYQNPGAQLKLAAITGTNGKTTVAAMLEAILAAAKERVGIIGTTGIRWPGHDQDNPLTTPDPVALYSALRQMVDAGCSCAAVEVSSHALDQHRVAGVDFHISIFTNLSQDHLDYHGSVAEYFAAKAALFLDNPAPFAIINLDDPHGVELYKLCPEATEKTGFSMADDVVLAAFRAGNIELTSDGCRFRLSTPDGEAAVNLPTVGRFNIANAIAAAGAAWRLGVDKNTIVEGLAQFQPQPGRMASICRGQPFTLIVDFAHTPDALENLLKTAREITPKGRIITVFGCGGDRDRGKRRLMGRISARLGDLSIITDDNPRSENPAAIRDEISAGCQEIADLQKIQQIGSRKEAICHALGEAKPGDTVLIAGKGHETYQITASGKEPFDDSKTATAELIRLGF
jgi:UDP-N-acetylmuramoyl-L-alanyl-D-glutamate--2,6-diaminopimelate ligase